MVSLEAEPGQVSKSNSLVLLSFVKKKYSRSGFCFVLFSFSLGGQKTQQALGMPVSCGE